MRGLFQASYISASLEQNCEIHREQLYKQEFKYGRLPIGQRQESFAQLPQGGLKMLVKNIFLYRNCGII